MLEVLLDKTPAKIDFVGNFPEERLKFKIKFDNQYLDDPKSFAFNVLNSMYGFSIETKDVEKEVQTLTIADKNRLKNLYAKKGDFMTSVDYEGNEWIGKNVSMSVLITFLERELGVVVRDKTNIHNSLNIRFNKESTKKAMQSLEELGFGVSQSNENIEITIVEIKD